MGNTISLIIESTFHSTSMVLHYGKTMGTYTARKVRKLNDPSITFRSLQLKMCI